MAFPADPETIRTTEVKLGRSFPSALRDRLQSENGGEVAAADEIWFLYPVQDTTDRRRLKRTMDHIVRMTDLAAQAHAYPRHAIAIAENGGGDLLVLPEGRNEIYRWDHETGVLDPVEVQWYPEPDQYDEDEDEAGGGEGFVQNPDLHATHDTNAVLLQDPPARYDYFVQRVAETGEVWSLRNADGWVLLEDDAGKECAPFWPSAALAALCARAEWRDAEPASIALDSFLSAWVPGLERDTRRAAVFPTPRSSGQIVQAAQVGEDIQRVRSMGTE